MSLPLTCPDCGGAGGFELSVSPFGREVVFRVCSDCDGKGVMLCAQCGDPAIALRFDGPLCAEHDFEATHGKASKKLWTKYPLRRRMSDVRN